MRSALATCVRADNRAMPLASGTTMGRYRIESRIGGGAMGVVYLALDTRLQRRVAIKLIEPSLAADPDFRARFEREGRAAAGLDHPHVLPVYEAGEEDDQLYLAMRYVAGFDLSTHLARHGPLDLASTARLAAQLGGALDAAHKHGLIHRDVKPANVLLGPHDHAYLADFGLAVTGDARITRAGTLVGTADYTAPELLLGAQASAASDIYALACLLAECLTGEPPYHRDGELATLHAHANAPTPDLTSLRPDLPPAVQDVFITGLAKRPESRFASAGALATALSDAAGRRGTRLPGVQPPPAPRADSGALIGRAAELGTALALLEDARCVSLTGPGGSGKTRLAQAVVSSMSHAGIRAWFVDASQLREPELLAPAIAAVLDAEADPAQDAVDAIVELIGSADALVAIDNLEQMPGAGTVVERLLERVSTLRILTTSRTRLGAQGEAEYLVPTLSLPVSDRREDVEASPAGELFLTRARSVGFAGLDDRTATSLAMLLRRLDGLPLAIELAAARMRIVGPAEVLYWLDERGLAAVDAATPDAHRSLNEILIWTIGLLSRAEATILKSAAVCAGFDVGLVQRLAPKVDALGPIEALVGLGLFRRVEEVDGSARFALLETIRAHVLRRLTTAERRRLRTGHAEAMQSVATLQRQRMRGMEHPQAVARLVADADNYRHALDWLDETAPEQGLELWTALEGLWGSHRNREGMARFEHTASLAPARTLALSRATSRYVGLAFDIQGSVRSKELNAGALELAREVGDLPSEVEALGGIVMAAVIEDDRAIVRDTADEVARLSASLDDPEIRWTAAQTRCFAAMSLFGAQSDEMRDAYREAVDLAVRSGRVDYEMNSRGNLAVVQLYRREFEDATANGERAVHLARQVDSHLLNWCLSTLAIALAESGNVSRAVEALAESAADVAILSVPERVSDVLTAAAAVALAADKPLVAARLVSTVKAMYAADPSIAQPENADLLDGVMTRASQRAEPDEVRRAVAVGHSSDPLHVVASVSDEIAMPHSVGASGD